MQSSATATSFIVYTDGEVEKGETENAPAFVYISRLFSSTLIRNGKIVKSIRASGLLDQSGNPQAQFWDLWTLQRYTNWILL